MARQRAIFLTMLEVASQHFLVNRAIHASAEPVHAMPPHRQQSMPLARLVQHGVDEPLLGSKQYTTVVTMKNFVLSD